VDEVAAILGRWLDIRDLMPREERPHPIP
jgi:hypothetical protein